MPKLIVAHAVADRSLVDLSRVKSELGITGPEQDELLRAWIKDDSDAVCEACGVAPDQKGRRTFLAEEVSINFSAAEAASGALVLPWRLPFDQDSLVVSIAGTDIVAGAYTMDAGAGLLNIDGFGRWGVAVTVTGTVGWELQEVPAVLRNAVARLARLRWATKRRDPTLKAKEVEGVGREEYWIGGTGPNGSSIPADVLRALQDAGLAAPKGW
ncbi:hypothetical protein [Azospirillum tabaci]|uniref:hypothetical protein n=1 Tax=Azospirillum tabaci TaxID=2752310 RepID=UPI001661289E|nr:hypothetical protein [Azospirillum tabaci]